MLVPMTSLAAAAALAVVAATAGCGDGAVRRSASVPGNVRPDEPPVVVNGDLPFRYPPALYARKVQGNVTLKLFIDRDGKPRNDSTKVEESSGLESLDSAAVRGSQELRFVPAKLHGEPVAVSVLFPVYFRHPEANPLPGDTLLGKRDAVSNATSGAAKSSIPPRTP
ncbi:MAG: energy transducer TonB [Gemmatimonadota bacterium]